MWPCWHQLEFTVDITGHQDFALLRKVSVDWYDFEWLKFSSSQAAHKANEIHSKSLVDYLFMQFSWNELQCFLLCWLKYLPYLVKVVKRSLKLTKTSRESSVATQGDQQNMHPWSCCICTSAVCESKVFAVCWLLPGSCEITWGPWCAILTCWMSVLWGEKSPCYWYSN